jgi:hypothetical protein
MATSDDVLSELRTLHAELVRELRSRLAAAEAGDDKPLKQRDILRSFLTAMENRSGVSSSVVLSRNAKGDAQFEVTVRSGDSPEIVTAADAHREAVRIFDALSLTYKRESDAKP